MVRDRVLGPLPVNVAIGVGDIDENSFNVVSYPDGDVLHFNLIDWMDNFPRPVHCNVHITEVVEVYRGTIQYSHNPIVNQTLRAHATLQKLNQLGATVTIKGGSDFASGLDSTEARFSRDFSLIFKPRRAEPEALLYYTNHGCLWSFRQQPLFHNEAAGDLVVTDRDHPAVIRQNYRTLDLEWRHHTGLLLAGREIISFQEVTFLDDEQIRDLTQKLLDQMED